MAAMAALTWGFICTITEKNALAVHTAWVAKVAAPRQEAAWPPRSLVAATTGAPSGVLIVAASAFSPLTSRLFPWILVCPNAAPCLWCPVDPFCIESISRKATASLPGSNGARRGLLCQQQPADPLHLERRVVTRQPGRVGPLLALGPGVGGDWVVRLVGGASTRRAGGWR